MENPPVAFDLTILSMAKGLAAHAAQRQGLVAENVANADTRGYRAQDVKPFAEIYEASGGEGGGLASNARYSETPSFFGGIFIPIASRPGHEGYGLALASVGFAEPHEITRIGADSPNGNSVSLEDQMVRGAGAQANHELALGVFRKSMDLIRMAIGRS